MQIEAIQTFLVVVRLGSLSRAAEQLNVTQSTIAGRIDALEDHLRQRLVNRSKKGATPTAAGSVFLRHARQIVENWQLSQQKLILPHGLSMMFTFGCTFDLWTGLGERIYKLARGLDEGTAFQVQCGSMAAMTEALESGLADAILVPGPLSRPNISCQHIYTDRLIQASSTDRWAVKWDPGYIRISYDENFDAQHISHWPDDNIAHATIGHPDWGLRLLLQQGGSAYLPERLVCEHFACGRLFPVRSSPVFERPCYFAWRSERLADFPWIPGLLHEAEGLL
ncbi:LysR family transcriptional regulator [Pseudogemmobacter humi]|uniref:HTH-type transcriptional regulator YofA n=1 Tax=Pseudogemmobacter humi TaxID=2483812 RepID=A0A3P5WL95_9RHOB|nr:LysR family transcriptional regulator [Pseudogemmobacter humi]VDC20250.1 HTH-type transcriptional regulator YofA [Pseudogemmobacter humi]